MIKTYKFDIILKEYNKKYGYDYILPPSAFNITIVHEIKSNHFYVTYENEEKTKKDKKSLKDFISFFISIDISSSIIKQIIVGKESEKENLKIVIWPSNKIRYAYLSSNYFMRGVGNLGKSCMRSKEMQISLGFYTRNKAKIVVVIDTKNKIHGRALLWDNVKNTKNKKVVTYLDRVYLSSETILPLFVDLANKNNWERYDGRSAGNARGDLYKDNLDIKGICHLPYTDTFRHLYYKDNVIVSSSIPKIVKERGSNVSLTTTGNGGYFAKLDPNRIEEVLTGCSISKKDATFVKRYKGYVLKKNIANIEGCYYSQHDNLVVDSSLDGWILKENHVNEVITDNGINKTKAIHSDNYKGFIHKSNIIHIGDNMYHKKDTNVICFRGKWYHASQCFVNYDREKRNIALSKKKFHSWIEDEVFVSYPDDFVVRDNSLIPKEHAIIAYDLIYSPVLDDIEYQEVYRTNTDDLIQLTTGELIVKRTSNRKYLKKFNNKWYIKQDFKLPDKKQLLFDFMRK